jgi:trehalose 6-phosphate synthase/phosphatase
MQRLLIVSNRLPVSASLRNGEVRLKQSVGGLATGLRSFYQSFHSKWIGWPGLSVEIIGKSQQQYIRDKLDKDFKCCPVFLRDKHINTYYHGFCNNTIWPLFHSFTQYAVYDEETWESYKHVNEMFSNEVCKQIEPGDLLWIHDYHLMLLPKLIREKFPDISIGYFLHIPFPSYEIFRFIPWREEILEGLFGADLIGFHTYDYARHFLSSIRRILGYEAKIGRFPFGKRMVKIGMYPMGIDYERFSGAVQNSQVVRKRKEIKKKLSDKKLILSVDRMDYTKGILHRLKAFDEFLDKNPKYRGEVTLILVAVPSRIGVEHYRILKSEIDELIGKINGKYGEVGWTPIWYFYRSLPFNELVAFYSSADICLVTPLRDGMNLIAKEYIATRKDGKGVLILSEMAGAVNELNESIIINPNCQSSLVGAIEKAFKLSQEEQVKRNKVMQSRLQRYNVTRWANDFIEDLQDLGRHNEAIRLKSLSPKIEKEVINKFRSSKKRLLLLDYDGTLVPFADKPEKAMPDDELLRILDNLAKNDRNQVVIISGRVCDVLDSWFSKVDVEFVAEHGAWLKKTDEGWRPIEEMNTLWKDDVRPILEIFSDRTPGSFIEEKDYSLVWHFREVDPELGALRTGEIIDVLQEVTLNNKLSIMAGSKVIEIKNPGVDKGNAAMVWVRENPDFIVAIGDDRTDENMFITLPDEAITLKVGGHPSKANYFVADYKEVRSLLKKLID